jgi:glycosyltransferase involved in cell wall biosynthesis
VRIALFCPSYGQVGGIEEIASALIAAFRHAGHDVVVLARSDATGNTPSSDVPIVRLPFHQLPRRARHVARQLRFLGQLPGALSALRRAVLEARSEVVLVLAITSYAPYMVGLSRVAPVVVSLEGGEPGGEFTANPRLLRRALRRATRVVACARSLAASARALAPDIEPRLTVIPNGVDPGRFGDGPAHRHSRPYIAAVGRLVPQKGFDVLLEAFASVPIPVDLLIAGDGPERPRLERMCARLGIHGRVHLLGSLDAAAVAGLYRGSAVVAVPSRWEGLPLVCLEAMAIGRAVVASRVDGIPDAVVDGQTGLLVPRDDPEKLAEALTVLLSDPARCARFGARAREVVQRDLTWATVSERYMRTLAEAVAVRRPS